MPINIETRKNSKGGVSAIIVEFSGCPPEVINAFLSGFREYRFQSCQGDSVIYSVSVLGDRAAISHLFALNRFRDKAASICSDYESFFDDKSDWEDRLYAVKRKYQGLQSNISTIRKRHSEVSQSAYGAEKLVLEVADDLAKLELELDKLGTRIAVASF